LSLEILEEIAIRREARNNLLSFTEYTKDDFESAAHHKLITAKLEEVERKISSGEGARQMIFMPPRHTKSELGSRRFPAWCLGRNPTWQIITATYSGDFAADFGRDVRGIVNSEEYKKLFPDVSLNPDVRAAARWNTNKGGIYVAAGVGGALTGRGAHLSIIDDPIKDAQAASSEALRAHAWKWYLSVLRTRLMPGGAIVLIMTRWHDDDLAGRLIAQQEAGNGEEWDIVSLPALIETEKEKQADPLGREIGESIWPAWFPPKDLLVTKAIMPVYEWSALYQQKPVPDEGDFFKKEYFKWYETRPQYLNIYITHDDAVSENTGDFTEIAVWGVDQNENIFAIDWFSGQVASDIWIEQLIDFILKYNPIAVIGETGPIRKAIEPFLLKRMEQRKAYTLLKWLPTIGDKESRCAGFRGLASMGKIYLPKSKAWSLDVISQLIRFPNGVFDDKADTCGLMGRTINETWATTPPKRVKKVEMHKQPTLNELIEMNKKTSNNGLERIG